MPDDTVDEACEIVPGILVQELPALGILMRCAPIFVFITFILSISVILLVAAPCVVCFPEEETLVVPDAVILEFPNHL